MYRDRPWPMVGTYDKRHKDRGCPVFCTVLENKPWPRKQKKTGAAVGRRVAGNKGANGKDSGCSIAGEQLRSGKRKRRRDSMRASKAPRAGCERKLTQNGQQGGQRRHSPRSPAPRPTSRSMVLCRPVAVTGYDQGDPPLYTREVK